MLTLVPSSRFVFKVEAEPMNIWSPRVDPEAGDMAILPSQPSLAMQVGLDNRVNKYKGSRRLLQQCKG